MWGMSTNKSRKELYVRYTPKARHALKMILSEVQAPELLSEVTQEEFITASWLWMREVGPKAVAAGVSPHIQEIREFLAKEEAKGRSNDSPPRAQSKPRPGPDAGKNPKSGSGGR